MRGQIGFMETDRPWQNSRFSKGNLQKTKSMRLLRDKDKFTTCKGKILRNTTGGAGHGVKPS